MSYVNISKPVGTPYTNVAKPGGGTSRMVAGMTMGLLIPLTLAVNRVVGSSYTTVSKPTGSSYTNISKPI